MRITRPYRFKTLSTRIREILGCGMIVLIHSSITQSGLQTVHIVVVSIVFPRSDPFV